MTVRKWLWVFSDRSGAWLVVNNHPKEEKKSSVGSTWWNWKLSAVMLHFIREFIAPGLLLTARISIWELVSFLFTSARRSPVQSVISMIIRADSLWCGVKAEQEEISFADEPYPCVCIRNDFVNPCEEPDFWWNLWPPRDGFCSFFNLFFLWKII